MKSERKNTSASVTDIYTASRKFRHKVSFVLPGVWKVNICKSSLYSVHYTDNTLILSIKIKPMQYTVIQGDWKVTGYFVILFYALYILWNNTFHQNNETADESSISFIPLLLLICFICWFIWRCKINGKWSIGERATVYKLNTGYAHALKVIEVILCNLLDVNSKSCYFIKFNRFKDKAFTINVSIFRSAVYNF